MKLKEFIARFRNTLLRGSDTICYDEAIELYDRGTAILIDVKSKEEFEEGHIDGAINIPVYEIEDKINSVTVDKNKIIIVYCKTGKRSKMAKQILKEKGYINVYVLIL